MVGTMFNMRVNNELEATEAQLNALADVTPGTMAPSKAVVLSSENELIMTRSDGSYGFGIDYDGDAVFALAGAALKSYVMQISGWRDSAYPVTGDSNDAILKIVGNNAAANDANFILRGLNASVSNRSGGTLGRIEHSLGSQNKSGGTVPAILGVTVVAENYGTCADLFGGIDILLKNEGSVATKEFGLRIRNENNSIADAVGTAIEFSDTGANTGFDRLFDATGASLTTSLMNLKDDGTVVEKDNSQAITNLTTAGFIKIEIDGTARYIWLASNSPSA